MARSCRRPAASDRAVVRLAAWDAGRRVADEGARHRGSRVRRRERLLLARSAPSRLGARRARQPAPPRVRAQPCPAAGRRRRFVHGDVRERDDLERGRSRSTRSSKCSAEPSVLAGLDGGPRLPRRVEPASGRINCLELAGASARSCIFLSTSRVYPVAALARARARETRDAARARRRAGRSRRVGRAGSARTFPLGGSAHASTGRRSSRPSCSIAEYVESFGLRAVVNRCGVVAGPWQLGKVDQGVFALLDARAPLRAAAHVHRVRRHGQAGARRPARRRPRRPARGAAARARALAGRRVNVGGGRER